MIMTEIKTKEDAWAFFAKEAAKQGKTLKQFIDEDIRELLESAWHIQKLTGKAVKIDDLVDVMNGHKKAEECKE
jgi:hypothetical protein